MPSPTQSAAATRNLPQPHASAPTHRCELSPAHAKIRTRPVRSNYSVFAELGRSRLFTRCGFSRILTLVRLPEDKVSLRINFDSRGKSYVFKCGMARRSIAGISQMYLVLSGDQIGVVLRVIASRKPECGFR